MIRGFASLAVVLTAGAFAVSGLAAAEVPRSTGSSSAESISVQIEPQDASVKLGETLPLRVTVANNGPEKASELVVHLDVTDPRTSTSVDPEDWTSTLSKKVGAIAPGGTGQVEWNVQPISGGDFVTYAVALAPQNDSITVSNAATIHVDHQQTLNAHGILAVALGVPATLGALLLLQRWMSRTTAARRKLD